MRNALQFAVNLPVQFRSNSEITSTSGFDFNAGLSSDTTSTTKDVPIPIYNTPKI